MTKTIAGGWLLAGCAQPPPPPGVMAARHESSPPPIVDAGLPATTAPEGGPPALSNAEFETRRRLLSAFSWTRIGPFGGGPVPPSEDVVAARELVALATKEQLQKLVTDNNPAVRAHAAREIMGSRPSEAAIVRALVNDHARITIGNMADYPPFVDRVTTVGALVKSLLDE